MSITWSTLKKPYKRLLFDKYVDKELENEKNNYENNIIDEDIYNKNKLFLLSFKKNIF